MAPSFVQFSANMKSFLHSSPYRSSRPSSQRGSASCAGTSRHRQSLVTLLITLLVSSLVSASAVPDVSQPLLPHGMFLSRTGVSASGGSVPGHRPDSREGQGRGPFRYGETWVIDSSLENEAASLPILVAPEEEDLSQLHARSSDSSTDSDSLPTAFDTNLNNNFTTESCPKFFNAFLSNSTITACYPISLLLHDSTSFFHTLTSAPATSHVLDLSCAASLDTCTSTFSHLATSLLKDDACGKDYKLGNPLVTDAYTGFITYEPVRRAACLKNPTTTDYCFVDAVTNASAPQNFDPYSIPWGDPLVSDPWPACNDCLQATMDIFSRWAQVDGQPLDASYLPSALALNRHCGDNFANVNITVGSEKKAVTSGAAAAAGDLRLLVWTVVLVAFLV